MSGCSQQPAFVYRTIDRGLSRGGSPRLCQSPATRLAASSQGIGGHQELGGKTGQRKTLQNPQLSLPPFLNHSPAAFQPFPAGWWGQRARKGGEIQTFGAISKERRVSPALSGVTFEKVTFPCHLQGLYLHRLPSLAAQCHPPTPHLRF